MFKYLNLVECICWITDEHVKISTDGLELKDNTDVGNKFAVDKGGTIASFRWSILTTLDVSIIKFANNWLMQSDGLVISQSGVELLSLLQPPQLVTQVQNTLY